MAAWVLAGCGSGDCGRGDGRGVDRHRGGLEWRGPSDRQRVRLGDQYCQSSGHRERQAALTGIERLMWQVVPHASQEAMQVTLVLMRQSIGEAVWARVKDGLITDEDMRILEEALLGLKAQYQRSHSHA